MTFDDFMISHNFRRSEYDWCVYIKQLEDEKFIFHLLYVDDMLLACHDINEINNLKSQLSTEFEMKDLGAAKKILGMEITRHRKNKELFLSQSGYLRKVLERLGMDQCKPIQGPIASDFKLSSSQSPQTQQDKLEMSSIPYASGVGSLMYAMVCSRPDLSYAVSLVSRFMGNLGKEHWNALKWIFRYIRGTLNVGLRFKNLEEESEVVHGYVDSDYAGNIDTRKSLTGDIFTIYGTTVSWEAMLQPLVALSTTEAEYLSS